MAITSSKDFIVFPNDNSGRIVIKEQAFTSNGNWTAPAGVTSAQVILVGGGGGGGGGSQNGAGGGGAGGQVVVKQIDVVPGTSYPIGIGAGGQGGLGSQTSATDVVNTLPGANGGTTTFGTITYGNLLLNAFFDYGFQMWDGDIYARMVTGTSGASVVTVYPNANGIVAGMFLSATNTGNVAQVVSVSGNNVTLSVANTGTVNTLGIFDTGNTTVKPSTAIYQRISDGTPDSNSQGSNKASSPKDSAMSNNLLQPQVGQMEDPVILTAPYVRVFGTNPATLSITNAGLPTKLSEMLVTYTSLASFNTGDTTLNVTTDGLYVNMYVTGTGIASGTYITNVFSSSITISAPTTATVAGTTLTFSFAGTSGKNALLTSTPGAVSSGNPTWFNLSNLNTNSLSNLTTSSGFQGVPYQPGATYTISAYVSSNLDIATATAIKFQLRSTGGTYGANPFVSYAGGTNSGTTSSIDAGTANGFFVRETTASALAGYGGTVTTTATGSNGSTNLTVASNFGILVGMVITGSGIQANTKVTTVTGTTIGLDKTLSANLSNTTVTVSTPTGIQLLGSTTTVGQNGWRRITATFTTPSIGATLANGVYAYGSTPQFIYPSVVLQQPTTNVWFDNIQMEVGSNTTSWRPPLFASDSAALVQSTTITNGNLETSHRFLKATAGNVLAGSAWVLAGGSANTYRPYYAWIEYFDSDYNSLGRTNGTFNFLPITGLASGSTFGTPSTYPVRVAVTATAPTGTKWYKFGVSNYQGSTSATAGQVEYHVLFPQVELNTVTAFKRPGTTYRWAGNPGSTPLISVPTLKAEGGGGGGTYNSNLLLWQYGIEGGNNGGHAANNDYRYPTLAGGGGGAGGAGGNGVQYAPALSAGNWTGGWVTSGGSSQPTFPMRGNNGGYGAWNTNGGTASSPGYAGDGGAGLSIAGLVSGSEFGIPLGGGGGGGGWIANAQNQTVGGRGNGGGGKGGGTYLVSSSNSTADYYARGIDALANTGGGGGGGGSNYANAPFALATHNAASSSITYESTAADAYKWTPYYNANISVSAQAGFYGSNVLRVQIQDVGNARVGTAWTAFPILPRTPLIFSGVAARLTTAPDGVTSTQFPGNAKRVRPVVRWRTYDDQEIRTERPPFDIIFAGVNTVTYLGPVGTPTGAWQTLLAPDNAAYFDILWEFDYFDGGDIVDVDLNTLQYLPYLSNGGNGADGYAAVRWLEKASV